MTHPKELEVTKKADSQCIHHPQSSSGKHYFYVDINLNNEARLYGLSLRRGKTTHHLKAAKREKAPGKPKRRDYNSAASASPHPSIFRASIKTG